MEEGKKSGGLGDEHYFIIPPEFLSHFSANPFSDFLSVEAIGQFIKASHHYFRRYEGIDTAQLIYCYEGTGYYRIDGKEARALNPGQLVILPPGKPHDYASSNGNPWSVLWIHVKGSYFDLFYKTCSEPELISISEEYGKRIKEIFSQCFDVLSAPYQWEEFIHLCQLAATIISLLPAALKQSVKGLSAGGLKGVESAISYMKNRIRKTVTLEDLAAAAGFSPSHFHYLFRSYFGYPPVEYYLRLKIQAASKDIIFSDVPIRGIAEAYGIEDPYYFSRLFKKFVGLSPAQYRKSPQLVSKDPTLQDWIPPGGSSSE